MGKTSPGTTTIKLIIDYKNNNIVNQLPRYSCGPTVYDASHMGHARSYMSFDILRRVLRDYFGYDITYVMNITDIDDKIIKRARQNYLYEKYAVEKNELETLQMDVKESVNRLSQQMAITTDPDKKVMQEKSLAKVTAAINNLTEAIKLTMT